MSRGGEHKTADGAEGDDAGDREGRSPGKVSRVHEMFGVQTMIQPLVAGQRADQVLTVLAADQIAFCAAVGANNAFTSWVTGNQTNLTATMTALPNWGAWIDAFRALNAWELLLRLAGAPALKANLRTGIIAKAAWGWLVRAVPHPWRPSRRRPQSSTCMAMARASRWPTSTQRGRRCIARRSAAPGPIMCTRGATASSTPQSTRSAISPSIPTTTR
jgi:hypothetical protein